MSFYGNITNLSPAQFVFDKIYNSRVEMEADKENFFPGRFALVRYSDDFATSYNADKDAYKETRTDFDSNNGYDSTVWQKDYSNNFILIAALKGHIPELNFFTLAPSENAPAAVIKTDDAGTKYDFYIPGHWKLKIDEDGYNINAAGADKQHRNKDEENEDELKITQIASGLNDIEYYDSEGNKITNPQDTLEVKLNFPSLGNMVCDGYDLIYGYNENNQMRPLDTQWYDGTEIEKSKNGDSLIGGKTYDLNTIAGSLNTIHNRLGQIVIEKTGNYVLDDLSENFIYKIGDKYYRKGAVYEEDDNVGLFEYEKVENLMESEFQQNKYYQKTTPSGDYEVATSYNADLASNENPSLGYFIKKINGIRYQAKTLIPYEQNTYYLKEGEEKYLLDTSESTPSNLTRKYYSINPGEPISTLMEAYSTNGDFYVKVDNNYLKYTNSNLEEDVLYYKVRRSTHIGMSRYYHKNAYYYKQEDNYVLDESETVTPDRVYYTIAFDTSSPQYGLFGGQILMYYPMIGSPIEIGTLTQPEDLDTYCIIDDQDNIISYQSIGNLPIEDGMNPYTVERDYYQKIMSNPLTSENLFVPGVYWEKDEDNNYIKSYEWDAEKDYYLITASQLTTAFYLPETYYYQDPNNEDEYILDTNLNMTQDRQYYIKKRLYVVKDEYGNCPYGYEWSDYSAYIPPSITLCTRTEKPGLIELKGFADGGESSINGILLHLHTLYDTANEGIRDTSSLNGALNSVKDILYQIKDLKPGRILEVNDFGQITSTEYTVKDLINIQDLTELSENFEEYERNYNALSNKIDNIGSSYVTIGQQSGVTIGEYATAEGEQGTNIASGESSHAEGSETTASGDFSHVEGWRTIAQRQSQHVFGEYNIADTMGTTTTRGTYVEIVGNGTSSTRSNARTLDWNGNERLAGKLTVGADPVNRMDVVTKQYVDALEVRIAALEAMINSQ